MMNTAVQVTKQNALDVASVFFTHPNVCGVAVVGSVAREKRGNDLDLVVVTTGVCYATFVLAMREWTEYDAREDDDCYSSYKDERRSAALDALNFNSGFRGWLMLATRGFSLDLLLMPEGWQAHTEEIQAHLPHNDPNFVSNISKDAVNLLSTSTYTWAKEAVWL